MTRPESFNSVQKRSEFVQLLEETLTTAPLSLFSLPPDLCPVLFNLSTHTQAGLLLLLCFFTCVFSPYAFLSVILGYVCA